MTTNLTDLVGALRVYVAETDAHYARNYKSGVRTHAIPFFGDLSRAAVITVGLNPSATEFEGRGWPAALADAALTERLMRYFERLPHPWFAAWEEALALIGASYRLNAAHIDVSPRATWSASSVPDPQLFEGMLTNDLPWMLRLLEAAPQVRLLLLAGTANRREYLNEFIAKRLPASAARLEGSLARIPGRGKMSHHVLVVGTRRLPVYFCSSSPSDQRNRTMLGERVARDAELLRRHLL